MTLNARQRATLDQIFTTPTPQGIRWAAIEALFVGLGGKVREGRGSRVRVTLGDRRATFHRPHPRPETGRETVRDVRAFLASAGVTPA